MSLRPIQAQALFDAGTVGGLFGPIRVGAGKTLISLLIPFILHSRRPLLLTRANLIEKTKRERMQLAIHWPIPNFIRFLSYDALGRVGHADDLTNYRPDLIICDEAHRLKNRRAAVTRRVARYLEQYPETKFVAISGTILNRSLKECAHLLRWSLSRAGAPVPEGMAETDDWADAIDEKPNQTERTIRVGALRAFCTPQELLSSTDMVSTVRRAYRRRLTETPGVVATAVGQLGSSLTIQAKEVHLSQEVDAAFVTLRKHWRTPDGWPIADPMTFWRHALELALGFYYVWDPRPPQEWLEVRKEWAAQCRKILTNNRRNLDSELEVSNAVDRGLYPEATSALVAWRKIKGVFVPNTVPVWIDDSAVHVCALWAEHAPGIIWTEHVAFAERLAKKAGLTYYGQKGLDSLGRDIERHKGSLIASTSSCGEGRNLQAWNRNLVVLGPSYRGGKAMEQLLGRTHRDGQAADEVSAEILVSSLEHVLAFEQAKRDARFLEDFTGQSQKLLFADVVFPTLEEVTSRSGPRWQKTVDSSQKQESE